MSRFRDFLLASNAAVVSSHSEGISPYPQGILSRTTHKFANDTSTESSLCYKLKSGKLFLKSLKEFFIICERNSKGWIASILSDFAMTKKAFTLAEVLLPPPTNQRKHAFTLAEVLLPPPTNQRKHAFTLAEVLIALGIIGVVAALTIPTLIANHKKKEVVTKLEKIYTVMNQAVLLSEAENGELSYWYPDCGPSHAYTCTSEDVMRWYNEYLGTYISTTKVIKSETRNDNIELYFADGSILLISPWISDMYFFVNEKALKNPLQGKNEFNFNFAYNKAENSTQWASVKNKKFEPYSWNWDGTREGLFTTTNSYGCSELKKAYCGKLIQYEGWQIPEDYPIKF